MFIELPEELDSPGAVHDAVSEALKDEVASESISTKSKKEASVLFCSPEDARKAESVLNDHFKNKNLRITII